MIYILVINKVFKVANGINLYIYMSQKYILIIKTLKKIEKIFWICLKKTKKYTF